MKRATSVMDMALIMRRLQVHSLYVRRMVPIGTFEHVKSSELVEVGQIPHGNLPLQFSYGIHET